MSDSGIVLRLVDHSERHRIVTLFTPEHGRIAAIARNSRGNSKRFGGHLDLFHEGLCVWERSRSSSAIPALQSFTLTEGFEGIRQDITRFGAASFFVELVLVTTAAGDASPTQYELLRNTLSELADADDVRWLVVGFQLRWYHTMGVLPPLDEMALLDSGLPRLPERSLAIARALLCGASISDLDDAGFRGVGTLTRALRHRVATRPLTSLAFLHQVLADP